METMIGAFKDCADPEHVDNGLLSPLGDFYASCPSVCKVCHKRRTAAVQKRVTERMKEGAGSEVHSRKREESPDEQTRKLRELEAAYSVTAEASSQHGASPVQPSPAQLGGFGFGSTESLRTSYFLKSGQTEHRPRWRAC